MPIGDNEKKDFSKAKRLSKFNQRIHGAINECLQRLMLSNRDILSPMNEKHLESDCC
jgi:hypothetical protein